MNKKARKLYVYAVIMLVAAILVILGAAFIQSRDQQSRLDFENELSKQQVFNQTAQQNITQLMEENERLRTELSSAKDKSSDLEKAKTDLSESVSSFESYKKSFESLNNVWFLFSEKKYKDADDAIKSIDLSTLDQNGQLYYNALNALIKTKLG